MRGSRNFRRGGGGGGGGGVGGGGVGGGGVQVNLTTFFFLSSAYSSEVKSLISKKNIIFQGSRGGPTFSLSPPPLDPHMYNNNLSNLSSIKKTAFTDFKEEFVNRIREKEKRK